MATLSDDEFWKEQFDLGGNIPGSWFASAHRLLVSADALEQFAGNYHLALEATAREPRRPGALRQARNRMAAAGVAGMLRAMAAECLLKALWLKHGGKLTEDGQYKGLKIGNEHQLNMLAMAVARRGRISFSDREIKLLEQASFWITSGRYPIQRSYDYLVPVEHADGTIGPAQVWRGDPVEELRVLTQRLLTELGITFTYADEQFEDKPLG